VAAALDRDDLEIIFRRMTSKSSEAP